MTHGWLFVQAERGQTASFLKMVADQERLYPGITSPTRLGEYVWAWLVNEDDRVRRLGLGGFQFWTPRLGFIFGTCRLSGHVGWRVWAKAHGTLNQYFLIRFWRKKCTKLTFHY